VAVAVMASGGARAADLPTPLAGLPEAPGWCGLSELPGAPPRRAAKSPDRTGSAGHPVHPESGDFPVSGSVDHALPSRGPLSGAPDAAGNHCRQSEAAAPARNSSL